MDKPNIIVLMSDQHRREVAGCYGHPVVRTPHMDSIARQGLRYDRAYCASPLCGPSRCAFLTGTHPHTNGAVTHPNDRHRSGKKWKPQLGEGIRSLVSSLRDSGYRTHASGYVGTHHFDGDLNLEFDREWLGYQTDGARHYGKMVSPEVARRYNLGKIQGEMWEPAYANVDGDAFPYPEEQMWDSLIARDSCDFLKQHSGGEPFFLYCGFRAPHTPWCPPERFLGLYDPADIGPLPDFKARPQQVPRRLQERFEYFDIAQYPEEWVRRSIAAYYGMVSYMDDCVGRVLAGLDAAGLRENTIIVFAADHGENLYDHGLCEKHTLFDTSVRVPLILSWPGVIPANTSTTTLASLIDVLPTLLSCAGVQVPPFVEGVDLTPTFSGNALREAVFAEYYHSLDPCRMIVEGDYKFIHTEADICELYDLKNDPGETINLAWYPQYRSQVESLRAKVLDGWEIPDLPPWALWNDLNERKQKQRLAGLPIHDARTTLPDWANTGP